MAANINADTSGGLKLTSDTSGVLELKSAGTTIATVSSTGIALAAGKTLPATTAVSLTTASGSAPSYSARAWVNFNGVGTVAIRASGNVSSITDVGVGQYQVNFATAMSDVNYSYSGMVSNTGNAWSSPVAGAARGPTGIEQNGSTAPTTSTCLFETRFGASAAANGAAYDFSQVTINFFR